MPELEETEQEALRQHLAPSDQMLIAEALTRSGGTQEELEQAKQGPVPGAPWWTGQAVSRRPPQTKPGPEEGGE